MAKVKPELRKEAAAVAAAFRRFARSGYRLGLFTQRLYATMCQSFGFIAHYDRDGFFRARFLDPRARVQTLAKMLDPTPWPATAAEAALRRVVEEDALFDAAASEMRGASERREMEELGHLMAKLLEKHPNVISLNWTREIRRTA